MRDLNQEELKSVSGAGVLSCLSISICIPKIEIKLPKLCLPDPCRPKCREDAPE